MVMTNTNIWFLLVLFGFLCCSSPSENNTNLEVNSKKVESDIAEANLIQLDGLKLPTGFKIEVYAEGIPDARSMALSEKGTLFVGNRKEDKVYALRDTDGDFKIDRKFIIASGLTMPNGIAIKDGNLYVAAVSKLLRFDNIEENLETPPEPIVVYDDYPKDKHHGWKYIAFGPDGKLYVPVGAPCNICESRKEEYASITRMNADGSGREVYAKGVRNTVGITWHPENGQMWFTDNGRDMLGDNIPPCELNRATEAGQHFGYPYCHGSDIADPEFGSKFPCSDFVTPARKLGAHVAPLGLKFYTGTMFPDNYKNNIFIAEHGSWNRSSKVGYKISLVKIENNRAVSYDTFIEGWLDKKEQEAWGRPVDVLFMPDGSMLISDDMAGVIYRVTYSG
jgi:glucose/arabinose dehydrogenase